MAERVVTVTGFERCAPPNAAPDGGTSDRRPGDELTGCRGGAGPTVGWRRGGLESEGRPTGIGGSWANGDD